VKPGENHHDKLCKCTAGAMLKSKTRKCEKEEGKRGWRKKKKKKKKKTVGKKKF